MGQNEWYIFGRMITHQQLHEARAQFIVWMEPLALLNSWQTTKIFTTQHTPDSTLCVFVGNWIFSDFFEETDVAQTSRRSRRSSFLAQRRLRLLRFVAGLDSSGDL